MYKSSNFRYAADQLSIYLDTLNFTKTSVIPSIAQLVERRTVVVRLLSLGRWFESGSKEIFFSNDFFFFRLENRSKLFSSHLYLTFLHVLLLFWSAFYRA